MESHSSESHYRDYEHSEDYYTSIYNAEKYIKKLEKDLETKEPRSERERQLFDQRREKIAQLKELTARAKEAEKAKALANTIERENKVYDDELDNFIKGLTNGK